MMKRSLLAILRMTLQKHTMFCENDPIQQSCTISQKMMRLSLNCATWKYILMVITKDTFTLRCEK